MNRLLNHIFLMLNRLVFDTNDRWYYFAAKIYVNVKKNYFP